MTLSTVHVTCNLPRDIDGGHEYDSMVSTGVLSYSSLDYWYLMVRQ